MPELSDFISKSTKASLINCKKSIDQNKISELLNRKDQILIICGLKKALDYINGGEMPKIGITPFHLVILTSKKFDNFPEIKPYCAMNKNADLIPILESFVNLLKAQALWRQALQGPVNNSFRVLKRSITKNVLRFLLVDDNAFVRTAVSRQLHITFRFCSVAECENGMLAVEEIHKNHNKFDIILMDYNMPIMDGLEAATKIREFEQENKFRNIAIICIFCKTN